MTPARSLVRFSAYLWLCAVVACSSSDPDHDETLVVVGQEPEGANCEYGGVVIRTGIDANHDGILEDSEVSSSEYVCNTANNIKCPDGATVLDGPISLRTSADFVPVMSAQCIDGDLLIVGSDLVTLPELPNLTVVTGNVIVAGNTVLQSLGGLSALIEVGKRYVVQSNDALLDISALGALHRFAGGIAIVGNGSLVDLSGLESFVNIDGGLEIANNDALASLHGLDNLTTSTNDGILIRSNKNLSSVGALSHLQSAVLLEITGNAALTSVPLQSLQAVNVYVSIKDNAALAAIDLPALSTTGGLLVEDNPALPALDTPALVLSAAVSIVNDTTLISVHAPMLSYTTVDFDLVGLPALVQVDFSSMVAIGGPLYMYQLPQLPNLSGFASLSSIGGDFTLRACNQLGDFTGFAKLSEVANMTITENTLLSSFSGLGSFTKVGGNLVVSSNPDLPYATAQAFATSITVAGTVTIN